MPTILRMGGLRVAIYPNDHPPPHVHVIGPEGEAVFNLNCDAGPAIPRESYGLNATSIRQIAAGLLAHIRMLCVEWRKIHGAV